MMAVSLIEGPDFTRRENVGTAVHECAHAIAIESVGARVLGCQAYANGGGMTKWEAPENLAAEKRALVYLAGAAAEARFQTPQAKRDSELKETEPFISAGDNKCLEAILQEAAPNDFMAQARLYWRFVRQAERFAKREWNPIVRLAKRMMANGGIYIAEAAPPNPPPAPKPAPPNVRAKRERLLREAMEHIWGGGEIYP